MDSPPIPITYKDVDLLTKARLDGIVSSMSLLLHNSGKYRIEVLRLSPQADSNNAVLDFYVVQSDSEVESVTTVSCDHTCIYCRPLVTICFSSDVTRTASTAPLPRLPPGRRRWSSSGGSSRPTLTCYPSRYRIPA